MKKMLLILLAGSLVLLAGCDLFEGPAGADGLLETNVVTGSFKVPDTVFPGGSHSYWTVTLDNDLDLSNGVTAIHTGFLVPNIKEYQFSFTNVPEGEYYLFVVAEDGVEGVVATVGGVTNYFKVTIQNLSWPPEAFAYYGTFSDAEVDLMTGDSTQTVHPAAPNITVPEKGWVDLVPFTLIHIEG